MKALGCRIVRPPQPGVKAVLGQDHTSDLSAHPAVSWATGLAMQAGQAKKHEAPACEGEGSGYRLRYAIHARQTLGFAPG